MKTFIRLFVLFSPILGAGCKPVTSRAISYAGSQISDLTYETAPTSEALVVVEPTPTGSAPQANEIVKPSPTAIQQAAPSEPPLRFTLPTPGPAPKSLWRPPLYPTPWGLGPNDHFFFSRPIGADEVNWPEPDYRYGGIFFSSDIVHTGVDIPARMKTPVIAAGDGRVVWAGFGLFYGNDDENDPYGKAVAIEHTFGFKGQKVYSIYAHMDRIDVVKGQDVKTGDQVGIIGVTGFTTGPHLHFEVRTDKNSFFTTYNPELWLAPPQGWGVLVGRIMKSDGSLLYHHALVAENNETGQEWTVMSYGNSVVHPDPYYNENLVLSDLPAGTYTLTVEFEDEEYISEIEIRPGAVTYFTYQGEKGYRFDLPADPTIASMVAP